MKRIAIIGAGQQGNALLKLLLTLKHIHIVAVIDQDLDAPGIQMASRHAIFTTKDWREILSEKIDLVFETTGSSELYENLLEELLDNTTVITQVNATSYGEMLAETEELQQQAFYQALILSNIHEGLIVVDIDESVKFVNQRAAEIIGIEKQQLVKKPIRSLIEESRFPQVLRSRKSVINYELTLGNGKPIVSTISPIIDGEYNLKGAFAIFREVSEVVEVAERISGLNEVKKMLEAIFESSEEAISVVDEQGKGIMINPAYTNLTGLTKQEVIGKPATVDISEGDSMHMRVLQSRRAVKGVRMKVGPQNKDVIVNVSPIIVEGKLKGSVGVLHDVSGIQVLTNELKRARQIIRNLEAKYTFDDIICSSGEIKLALEQAKVGAITPVSVLLRGEIGTGKELFAHAIHNESNRKYNKFIRVNCAAKSESELDNELFGYEDGNETEGNNHIIKGCLEEANHGSIFLDDIASLPIALQDKLIRVLKEQKIVRVGGRKAIEIDVRMITSTDANLEKAVTNGTFSEELYYRLNRLPIYIPPLRERLHDLEDLIYQLIHKVNQYYGHSIVAIDEQALRCLKHYDWPGNIRELENVISRAAIFMKMNEAVITIKHLPEFVLRRDEQPTEAIPAVEDWQQQSLQEAMDGFEKKMIASAYRANRNNKTKTAEALGISIRNLYYKMDKYKIE
ncbi:sigma 54-interacting transcriptional regulator [Radiobacillus sp. PE A8.2]|uniref:sigma 54-interacting transcriptional regulator n=1 Tax=Radiobacillus sp. PE A8.2 TaxID=3380349 RepID=UPI00388F6A92